MKKKLLRIPLIAGLIGILCAGTALAMEPSSVSVSIYNKGKTDVQVSIRETATGQTEELTVSAGKTVEKTWSMDEPGEQEYYVENTDPKAKDPAYIVRVYTETDEEGILHSFVSVQIEGTKEKAEKLVFGDYEEETTPEPPTEPPTKTPPDNPPDEPPSKTGDNARPVLWIGITCGAGILLLCLVLFLTRKRRSDEGENDG